MQPSLESLRAQVQAHPHDHAAWHALGLATFQAGNLADALRFIEAAIAIDAKIALYHRNAGEMYRRQGLLDKATTAGRRAVRLAANDPDAHYNLGVAYLNAGEFKKSIDCFQRALALNPKHRPAQSRLGAALSQAQEGTGGQEHYVKAAPMNAKAVENAATAHALHDEGIALYRQGKLREALQKYDEGLAVSPDLPALLNSRGFVLQDLGHLDEAQTCFERAIELDPSMSMARLNLGMMQLKLGNWEHGWDNYEARWTGSAEVKRGVLNVPVLPLPQWRGEDEIEGQAILVVTEQGYGDTFQFSRYLRLLTRRFAKVGFLCSAQTLRILEWSLGDAVALFCTPPANLESWHWQCPLMSLPLAFKTRPDSIPADVPYLRVSQPARNHWRERLELAAPGRLRVGIAWAGRSSHQSNRRRSLNLSQLEVFLNDSRVTWVCLQKQPAEGGIEAPPVGVDWLDWTADLGDFADTAALVASLDLVVSVDSVMVHLAGALNVPVWMLDRYDNEWRWLHGRTDSPWYPRLRIFRQEDFGDWNGVFDRVRANLAALPSPRRILPTPPRNSPTPLPHTNLGAGALAQHTLPRRTVDALPEAHQLHQRGIEAWQHDAHDRAMQLINDAIAHDPGVALFHSNLAEMNRQRSRIDEAIRLGERAVALDPSMVSALSNLGIAYFDAKRLDDAEGCHQRALALEPALVQSLNNLGSIERARKNLRSAEHWYRRALAINADYVEALSNLGAVLVEDDRADAALPPLERALALSPKAPEVLCNLGLARLKQGQVEPAIQLLTRSLQLSPGYPESTIGLARALNQTGDNEAAIKTLSGLVTQHPERADAWTQLGTCWAEEDESARAEMAFMKALDCDPNYSGALAGLGNLQLEQGRFDEAERLTRQAISLTPDSVGARFQLTQIRTAKPGDENIAALEELAANMDRLGDDRKIFLHYALGKTYDDLRLWDKAFPHFLEGARLKRRQLAYDAGVEQARVRRIAEILTSQLIDELSGAGDPSDIPVFVLGMPRSGTTLTEQIIASHPAVHGAGELRDLMRIVQQPVSSVLSHDRFPENLLSIDRETLTEWGLSYVARLRERAPGARRVTDKMPANYLALGLIPLMLPNAKIIHVKRNPVDTCVSCFTRLFNRHQDATYELRELGQHYVNYIGLMEHWRSILPDGAFLDVQYEDIVADMEGQSRRLIAWVGLPWDDACLAFHKTERNVRTASVAQVRQPIYNTSVERWRNYEHYLDPLLKSLDVPDLLF